MKWFQQKQIPKVSKKQIPHAIYIYIYENSTNKLSESNYNWKWKCDITENKLRISDWAIKKERGWEQSWIEDHKSELNSECKRPSCQKFKPTQKCCKGSIYNFQGFFPREGWEINFKFENQL